MIAKTNLKPTPFSTGAGRDVLIGDHSSILPYGTFHRKSPNKISVSFVNPNWFGCKPWRTLLQKMLLNPLLIPNSKDPIFLHDKINLPSAQCDPKDNVLDNRWCATPDTCSTLQWPRAVILLYSKNYIISKTQSGSSKFTNALELENGCSTALIREKNSFYKAVLNQKLNLKSAAGHHSFCHSLLAHYLTFSDKLIPGYFTNTCLITHSVLLLCTVGPHWRWSDLVIFSKDFVNYQISVTAVIFHHVLQTHMEL